MRTGRAVQVETAEEFQLIDESDAAGITFWLEDVTEAETGPRRRP